MHHPKSLRSKRVRPAVISVALLCVVVSGCSEQQPAGPALHATSPALPRVGRTEAVPFNKFFTAWSQSYSSNPIETQMFALDPRQDRQYAGIYPDQSVTAFARANPGRLYINGDEPDQYCFDPYEYAGIYRAFVNQVRGADPTARVSPAGFAEPNDRCCPEPASEECRTRSHSIGYAEQFYAAYIRRFGSAPPVDEWRFHDFGLPFADGDIDGWWARVDRLATWSAARGAKMVLGAWGFHGWREPVPAFQEHMKQAMGRLMNDNRINGAVYWSYETWVESPRPLVNAAGGLTAEGQTYANPLTDVPTGVTIEGSDNGKAMLRWSNTTSAWSAEAEFWVKASGSNSFVLKGTELVTAPGAAQTPLATFNNGDTVKGRVRYYNIYGQAAWSAFSNTVSLVWIDPEPNLRKVSRKSPLFCFLHVC